MILRIQVTLHQITNDKGKIFNFMFTLGNVKDLKSLKQSKFLKNIAKIEHSRQRFFSNFIANSLSAIVAYCFFEKSPVVIEVNF